MIVFKLMYLFFFLRCFQVHTVHSKDPCEEHKTCQTCVRAVPSCKWCSSDSFNKSQRCMSATAITECPADKIESPKGSISTIGHDDDFNKTTQIKPQRFNIKLRPGESQAFDFSIKLSPNYPADLYFLLDSSYSMRDALRDTASAAEEIYDGMRKYTDDVLIGMGTFIDKNAAPFVRDKNPKNPISSYTNILNLTNNVGLFKNLVNNLAENTKDNYDRREGGFDALAQAITSDIGWRENSRKIIFFLTDDLSHTAGDGKFAGIVYPYDGNSYTDETGKYTKELEMDYPSIGMISELARTEGVTIIFLAEKAMSKTYSAIAEHIHGSQAYKFKKNQNSISFMRVTSDKIQQFTIGKLLSRIYKNITKTVKFGTTMTHLEKNNIFISFAPNCADNDNDKCTLPIKAQEAKNFQGNITLLNYYEENKISVPISIGSGIKAKLILDIEVVDCDCKDVKNESPYCFGHGTKKCGACECDKNWIGDNCKCMVNANQADDEHSCKPGGDNDQLPCNGEGYCECGNCVCNQGREGKFCECVKNQCEDNCNGHGILCFCGVCTCEKGWSGKACGCSENPCKTVNGKMCNGRGKCQCGLCKCEDRAAWDARVSQNRETCEMNPCTNCHSEQCLKLEHCARCSINDEADCSLTCQGTQVDFVEVLNPTTNGSICDNVKVGIGCYTRLSYEYDDVNYQINLVVQRESNCIESYYWWGGSVLLAVVAVGILTLVGWKLLTDWRDRQEYQSFLKQHHADSDKSCRNPIYEPASTTIRNPAFRKPSVDFTLR